MAYANRILTIDLSRDRFAVSPTPRLLKRDYLGGRGFTTRLLYELVDDGIDPLSPDNVLVFAVGPLSGTPSPSSGRYTVGFKSPLTGILGDSNSGGHFGPELKAAGYDAVVLKGRAPHLVYIFIDDDVVEIRDARDLAGKGIFETQRILRERHGKDIRMASIGPAGENMVLYANIMNDDHDACGRTGGGAVMGSKNLKCIAVRGSRDIEIADPERFLAKVLECHRKLIADKTYADFSEYGTLILVDIAQAGGGLSTRNGQAGLFEGYEKISCNAYHSGYQVASKACFSCILHCKNYAVVKNERYACEGCGPEYEGMVTLGSRVGVDDLDKILRANYLCNDYGIDVISAGTCIAFLMECHQKGLICEEFEWGDGDLVLECLDKIARREGIGDFLAQGVREMCRQIPESRDFALEVKGLEMPAFDVRTGKGFGLGEAVASRGGDHLRALPNFELLSYSPEDGIKWFNSPDCVNPYTEKGKPRMVLWHENYSALVDSSEMCKYCTFATYAIMPQDIAELLTYAEGREYTLDEVMRIGERIVNVERLFNLRCGLTYDQDRLPKRFTSEALAEGPAKGVTVDLAAMLPAYYAGRGWDERGVPTPEKLLELGID